MCSPVADVFPCDRWDVFPCLADVFPVIDHVFHCG
jgi:hypothetical protein